jgi:hypothetical protein
VRGRRGGCGGGEEGVVVEQEGLRRRGGGAHVTCHVSLFVLFTPSSCLIKALFRLSYGSIKALLRLY